MPWFSASENWVAAYFSDRQFSDLMSPAICCSPQTRNKEVGKIFINVKKYYLWLLKLYLFLDKNLICINFLLLTTIIFWNFSPKVLKIYRQLFFFNSENLLSSIEQCTWLHLYFPFGKFHLDISNKIADNIGTTLPHEIDFHVSKDCFCWIDIFIRWFEDYQLPYQFVRLLLLKVNKSVYILKSRQRYHSTLNNILLHVSNHALKDMDMLNYGTF